MGLPRNDVRFRMEFSNFSKVLNVPMRFIYPVVLVFLLGCSKDSDFTPVYDVPEDVQPFVETFINEAASRGFSFEIKNLIIKYDESQVSTHCGQCNSDALNANVQKVITIYPNVHCWFSPEEQEALLFHELGHCFLGRLHDTSLLPNGDPKSIMIQSNLGVYAPCIYYVGDENCNNTFKRPYYLDELFDEATPIPEWGK